MGYWDSYIVQLQNSSWHEFFSLLQDVSTNDIKDLNIISQINHVTKTAIFINNILEEIDPELIPHQQLQTFTNGFLSQSDYLLNNIKTFNKSRNPDVFNNIGSFIDQNILPLIYNNNIAAALKTSKSASKANRTAATLVHKNFTSIKQQVEEISQLVEMKKKELDELLRQASQSTQKIQEFEAELLEGDEDKASTKEDIEEIYQNIETWKDKIEDFHEKLTRGNEKEGSIILQIETAKKNTAASAEQTQKQAEQSKDIIKGLDLFYEKVFGKEDVDGNWTIGLEGDFDKKRKNLEDMTIQHQKAFKEQLHQIESLLPGATSAGLSDAFSKMQSSFSEPIKTYSRLFYLAMAGILAFGGYVMYMNIGLASTDASQFVNSLFLKLPILIALVWFAIFASKRRSEYIRLQQEYAHKEVLAKTYEGFKKQIKDLREDGEPLMNELIANAIIAISFNPSTTLDGKHGDKPPFIGAFEKLVAKIDKIVPDSKVTKDK